MTIEFTQPLAVRMRPKKLADVVGQEHLIGPGKVLTRMVDSRKLTSIILYGTPGTGKTTIAHALSEELGVLFEYYNAGVHSKKELQAITKKGTIGKPIILLIDEIHRLTKPIQDFLLMQLEEGSVILVGATTENPNMSINPAMRSRSSLLTLKPVTKEAVAERLKIAMLDSENGLGGKDIIIDDSLYTYIATQTNGDMRAALNTLELAVESTPISEGHNTKEITRDIINICIPGRQTGGDKDGDEHYNLLSAFQKSIRGSDVDATLHYLARLIQAGDLVSINRRLQVIAYEDIGIANPALTGETVLAIQAVERTGLPEARIILAHICVRLALSAKSNVAYKALDLAIERLNGDGNLEIPAHLKDAHYKGAKALGHGVGYKYPHAYPYNITNQIYLPKDYENDKYLQFRDESDTPDMQKRYRNINNIIK